MVTSQLEELIKKYPKAQSFRNKLELNKLDVFIDMYIL